MAQPTVTADRGDADAEETVPSYSVPNAAILIGIGPLKLWQMVRGNQIRSFTTDGRRFISRQALDDYLAEREVTGSPNARHRKALRPVPRPGDAQGCERPGR